MKRKNRDKAQEPGSPASPEPVKKKKKVVSQGVDLAVLRRNISNSLRSTLQVIRTESKDESYAVSGPEDMIVIGIPIPFPMEYLTQSRVLPLGGRITSIVGRTHANKTTMVYEFFRWLGSIGQAYLIEAEDKSSPMLGTSVIGYPDEGSPVDWGRVRADSNDGWQELTQKLIEQTSEQMLKKAPGQKSPMGRVYPVMIAIDSLSGKLARATMEKIEERGFADREHPLEALKNTFFLKAIPSQFESLPMHLIVTNQLKEKKKEGPYAGMEQTKAGGVQMDFQQTFEFQLKRIRRSVAVDNEHPGGFEIVTNEIRVECRKSGLGGDLKSVVVPYTYWAARSPADGSVRRYGRWGWEEATIDVLLQAGKDQGEAADDVEISGKGVRAATKAGKVREIVDIGKLPKAQLYWSKRLGVTKDAAVSKRKLGQIFCENEQVRQEVRDLFGIMRWHLFQPGVDFLEQRNRILNDIQARVPV